MDVAAKMTRTWVLVALLVACAAFLTGCGESPLSETEAISGELVIFHAGSLSVPFRELSALFTSRYPQVTVRAEASGTRDSARKISDLERRCDVFGAADYRVVENLLIPEYVDFNIRFARNEMVVAYTEDSHMSASIDAENWHEVLLAPGVAYGRSDPNSDPCGYRAVMVFKLAEMHYRVPSLAEKLAAKDGKRFVRPKETDLLALLEAGEIDYLFIYRSVAAQHGLKTLLLPDEINLKSGDFAQLYGTAEANVTGRNPGESIIRKGAPIEYSVTVPLDAPNRPAAQAYVALLLAPEGRAIMEANGQEPIEPAQADALDKLPAVLRPFCQ